MAVIRACLLSKVMWQLKMWLLLMQLLFDK